MKNKKKHAGAKLVHKTSHSIHLCYLLCLFSFFKPHTVEFTCACVRVCMCVAFTYLNCGHVNVLLLAGIVVEWRGEWNWHVPGHCGCMLSSIRMLH